LHISVQKKEGELNMSEIKFQRTLVLGLLTISLMACQSNPTRLIAPTKPSLEIIQMSDGRMCMDAENAEELAVYILELERAVK
jgi:hypothetical protein